MQNIYNIIKNRILSETTITDVREYNNQLNTNETLSYPCVLIEFATEVSYDYQYDGDIQFGLTQVMLHLVTENYDGDDTMRDMLRRDLHKAIQKYSDGTWVYPMMRLAERLDTNWDYVKSTVQTYELKFVERNDEDFTETYVSLALDFNTSERLVVAPVDSVTIYNPNDNTTIQLKYGEQYVVPTYDTAFEPVTLQLENGQFITLTEGSTYQLIHMYPQTYNASQIVYNGSTMDAKIADLDSDISNVNTRIDNLDLSYNDTALVTRIDGLDSDIANVNTRVDNLDLSYDDTALVTRIDGLDANVNNIVSSTMTPAVYQNTGSTIPWGLYTVTHNLNSSVESMTIEVYDLTNNRVIVPHDLQHINSNQFTFLPTDSYSARVTVTAQPQFFAKPHTHPQYSLTSHIHYYDEIVVREYNSDEMSVVSGQSYVIVHNLNEIYENLDIYVYTVNQYGNKQQNYNLLTKANNTSTTSIIITPYFTDSRLSVKVVKTPMFKPKAHGHSDATNNDAGFMTAAQKMKLDNIAANANNYVHPATHSISEVSGLQTALDSKGTVKSVNNKVADSSGNVTLDGVTVVQGVEPYSGSVYFDTKTPWETIVHNLDSFDLTIKYDGQLWNGTVDYLDSNSVMLSGIAGTYLIEITANDKSSSVTYNPAPHTHDAATTSKAGLMSSTDKTKLNGIADNANNYVHPATHSISEVSGLQAALDSKGTGTVKTVNGISPNAQGDVTVAAGGGGGSVDEFDIIDNDYSIIQEAVCSGVSTTINSFGTLATVVGSATGQFLPYGTFVRYSTNTTALNYAGLCLTRHAASINQVVKFTSTFTLHNSYNYSTATKIFVGVENSQAFLISEGTGSQNDNTQAFGLYYDTDLNTGWNFVFHRDTLSNSVKIPLLDGNGNQVAIETGVLYTVSLVYNPIGEINMKLDIRYSNGNPTNGTPMKSHTMKYNFTPYQAGLSRFWVSSSQWIQTKDTVAKAIYFRKMKMQNINL